MGGISIILKGYTTSENALEITTTPSSIDSLPAVSWNPFWA
jgi:hypothetical protein